MQSPRAGMIGSIVGALLILRQSAPSPSRPDRMPCCAEGSSKDSDESAEQDIQRPQPDDSPDGRLNRLSSSSSADDLELPAWNRILERGAGSRVMQKDAHCSGPHAKPRAGSRRGLYTSPPAQLRPPSALNRFTSYRRLESQPVTGQLVENLGTEYVGSAPHFCANPSCGACEEKAQPEQNIYTDKQ